MELDLLIWIGKNTEGEEGKIGVGHLYSCLWKQAGWNRGSETLEQGKDTASQAGRGPSLKVSRGWACLFTQMGGRLGVQGAVMPTWGQIPPELRWKELQFTYKERNKPAILPKTKSSVMFSSFPFVIILWCLILFNSIILMIWNWVESKRARQVRPS